MDIFGECFHCSQPALALRTRQRLLLCSQTLWNNFAWLCLMFNVRKGWRMRDGGGGCFRAGRKLRLERWTRVQKTLRKERREARQSHCYGLGMAQKEAAI